MHVPVRKERGRKDTLVERFFLSYLPCHKTDTQLANILGVLSEQKINGTKPEGHGHF